MVSATRQGSRLDSVNGVDVMSDVEEKPEEPKQVVQLEQAKSARSTCKITQTKIDKGAGVQRRFL